MGVTGIGAISFRARDPEALAAWYAEHLGAPGVGRFARIFDPEGDQIELWEPD